MTLNNLCVGDKCIIKKINDTSQIKRRLLDLGIIPGTKVECILENISKDMYAYLIRGTIIAIRDIDSKDIEVTYNEL